MIDNSRITHFINKKPSSLRYFQEGITPINIDEWRLTIDGEVTSPLSLTYLDILNLPSVYYFRRNVCVCLWSIKRHWEGVLLKDILALAGVNTQDKGLYLKQFSHGTDKGIYDSTIHLTTAIERNAMLAYKVDGNFLPLENGYPLRFIDFGLYLYKCVKALTRIEITRDNSIGFWEEYAGYNIDGTIMPKKYYSIDLQRKFYFDGSGEVQDSDL